MALIVTVRLLLDVEDEASAFDGTNEILREQQRSWEPSSCLIDYSIEGDLQNYEIPEDYAEGQFVPDNDIVYVEPDGIELCSVCGGSGYGPDVMNGNEVEQHVCDACNGDGRFLIQE